MMVGALAGATGASNLIGTRIGRIEHGECFWLDSWPTQRAIKLPRMASSLYKLLRKIILLDDPTLIF